MRFTDRLTFCHICFLSLFLEIGAWVQSINRCIGPSINISFFHPFLLFFPPEIFENMLQVSRYFTQIFLHMSAKTVNILLHTNKTITTPSEFNIDANPVSLSGLSSSFSRCPDYVLSCFDRGPDRGPSP